MKKLTALLLALSLTLSLASCTPDDPAPSPDPASQPPDPSTLAETYITELRSIFDTADIRATDPNYADQLHSVFTYDESFVTPKLDSVELRYSQAGFGGTLELASAAYAAVVEQYGEPNGEHAVPAYSIQTLLDRNTAPDDDAAYFDWWILPDRTLTLNIRFYYSIPRNTAITLTLEPHPDSPATTTSPTSMPSYSP